MKYSLLEDKSDQDSQSSEDYEALLHNAQPSNKQPLRKKFLVLFAILIPIASICLIGLGAWIGSRWLANPNDFCPSHVQHYCQYLEVLTLRTETGC